MHRASATLVLGILIGCGPSASSPDAGGGGGDGGGDTCTGAETRCVGSTFQQCQDGVFTVVEQCTTICHAALGCVDCNPDLNYCVGNDIYHCTSEGDQGSLVEDCGELECVSGACVDPCGTAAATRSYIGCEYMAVDLDNAIEVLGPVILLDCAFSYGSGVLESLEVCWNGSASAGLCDPPNDGCPAGYTCQTQSVCILNAQESPFAVVVSNPNSAQVTVTIENQVGTSQQVQVPAGQVRELFPQEMGFPDASIDLSGISAKAYKITSNRPIVAYQFNPLDNVDVFSNDGSLLIPHTTWDTSYYAMSYPTLTRRDGTNDYNGYVAVVAWEDDTEVAITPAADVRAGPGFTAIAAGDTANFTLDAFEVLNIESVQGPEQGHDGGPDLTGTKVVAVDGVDTFGVFGGHEAIVIPTGDGTCCADHIEEMMFPASTWGVSYALGRSQSRGTGEPDMVRVMAQAEGTTVSFNPAPSEGTCGTLGPGDFCEVKIAGDTEIASNVDGEHPILVGHYLVSNISASAGTGDPALSLGVPTEQFRTSYAFLVPSQYAENHVTIVAPAGSAVTLDSTAVTGLTPFGSGAFAAVRQSVEAGPHTVDCPSKCGIEVYGYDEAVSYLFAGGLDLERIVVD